MQSAIQRELAMPFEKGKNDCLSFCLSAISGMGVQLRPFKKFGKKPPKDAEKSFLDFCETQGWLRTDIDLADTGSFALCRSGSIYYPAVFDGTSFLSRSELGISTPQKTHILMVYRTVI